MGADIDDGAREILVLHARHGDEELVVQKPALRDGSSPAQDIHGPKASAFSARLKDASAAWMQPARGSSRRNEAAALTDGLRGGGGGA
jgi:hypothetical protein